MPVELRVLQSQRNEVLSQINTLRLDPREFRWEHVPSRRDSAVQLDQLIHIPTGFYYQFDSREPTSTISHYATFSPGASVLTETRYPGAWDLQVIYAGEWLGYLKRELTAPPLWEQLAQGEPLLEVPLAAAEDTPFTPEEQRAIQGKLDDVLQYLKQELPPGSMPTVQTQIARLQEAAKTSGRVSWLQMAIGTMIGLVWGGLMAPEQARTVLQMIGQAFQRLIGG